MRIGIEAQRIFRKNKHGMDIVALELINSLQEIDTLNDYIIFVQKGEDNGVLKSLSNIEVVETENSLYPIWEQVVLPREAKKAKIDLLHCTSNTAPISFNKPLLITLHDIIYLEKFNHTKGSTYQIAGNLYRRWNVPIVVKHVSKIITVSEFERVKIQNYFNLDDSDVKVIYNGVGKHFQKITSPDLLEAARKKYNLPDDYVFFIGNTDPKKNVEGVMRSLSILRKSNRLNFKLLMLDIDRDYLYQIAKKINDIDLLNHITFSGYVPNTDLPVIYSMASCFIYPSLRESFGIPILEAMACGTPVLTSNTSSMPEVAEDAALIVDPFNSESIANGIHRMLTDQPLRDQLITKGFHRASKFTWQNNALETLAIYSELYNK